MADNSEFLEVTSPAALKNLQAVNAELLKTIASVKDVNANMIGIKTPSGSDSAIKSLTAQYYAQRATIQKLQQQLNSLSITQSKVATSASTQAKATRENSVAQQILRAETDRNVRANTLLGGAYAKASAQLLILKKQAKDYAIALGEAHPKTLQAVKDANDLGGRIKSADAVVGDFQRNVGNYSNGVTKGIAGAFAGLRQLAYILPGLGIAGIFNLAIDAITPLIQKMDLFKSKIDVIAESKKALNDAVIEGNKSAVQELISLKGNLQTAQDINLSYKERMIAVDNLQKSYPFYFENLTKEQILAGETKKAEDALTEAILSRAKANAAVGKITENEGKIIDLELQRADIQREIKKLNVDILATETALQKSSNVSNSQGIALSQMYDRRKSLVSDLVDLTKQQNGFQSINNILTKYALANQEKAIGLDYKEEKNKEKKAKEKREDIEAIKLLIDTNEGLLKKLIEIRDGFTKLRTETSNNNEEFEKFNKLIEYYQTLIDSIEHNQLTESAQKRVAEFKKLNESMADTSKKTKELTKEQQAFFQQFQEGFFGDAGLPTLFKYLNGDLDEFTKNWQGQFEVITQIAQEAFKFISDASNKNFENEYANLEKQKNISLAFAGDDAAAKEEIQRQYEERRKKIAAREFKAKKEQALFNIAIDTAQAAVATLARTPLPAGLPFLIATLALGAAEAAIVASQQAPQFWRGTDNAPEGLAWTQEKGREIITDKFGNIKSKGSDKGAQLTYLNKGDKVLNNEKTMDYLMFDNSLNSILTGNNISTPIIEVNNNANFDKIGRDIINAIENKAEFSQLISNGDLKTVIRKGNTETEIMNRRINFLGKKV